jgi:hypothetical protein
MLGVMVSGTSPFTSSTSDESLGTNVEVEEEERRREDLNVRRPGRPEPQLGLVPYARRSSLSSPLQVPPSDHGNVTEEHDDGAVEEDTDTDATLITAEDDLEGKPRSHPLGEAIQSTTEDAASNSIVILHGTQLATPASSIGSLEADGTSQTREVSSHCCRHVRIPKIWQVSSSSSMR